MTSRFTASSTSDVVCPQALCDVLGPHITSPHHMKNMVTCVTTIVSVSNSSKTVGFDDDFITVNDGKLSTFKKTHGDPG